MSAADSVIESLKELLTASNPGFVTKEDLARVEDRLEELGELVDEIEERLAARSEDAQ